MRIARGISIANISKPISVAAAFDADALAFFTAANITDTTQKNAVNTLVLSLKSANIWVKMKALYPVVGGVASAHAVNLKTPGTYNLTFATGWTHASTGMTPNSATYADTFFVPNANLTDSNNHQSFYSRTDQIAANIGDIGSYDNNFRFFGMQLKYNGNLFLCANGINPYPTVSNANSQGFYLMTKNGSNTQLNAFKNTTKVITNGTTGAGISTTNVYLGAVNANGIASNYSTKQCAFASIGDGLTDAEASSLYTAVQTFQTTLGRQV